ncbi:MAG: ABC transporter ATP-binding protein/permease [Hyphomicrobiaceae bacterium]|nr:ABC transporter ATP-binding protein/permease [Hyphomicrobiaceae bacterium]
MSTTEPKPTATETAALGVTEVSESGNFNLDLSVAKRFLTFAGAFWSGSTARQAWLLTAGLAASLVLSTYITVQMNHWNRWFFDALEKKDVATVKQAILVFFGIIVCMAAIGVAIVITRETLQVRWRAWLVQRLIGTWLERQKFYHLNASGTEPPNPEYRISDDTRWATEVLVDLGIGLLSAVIGGAAFIAILWSAGGALTIGGVTIPGYMVWAALIYGVLASTLMAWIGRPLVGRVGQKNEAEGYFRFAMMRLRDNAESVALMRGGAAEQAVLKRFYDGVVERWLKVVRSHGHVTWITNASGPMIPIVPLLFAAPKYLSGELSLGQVTQLAAAFVQVQIAISWVVDNYNRIAEWYASARRVMDIVMASEAIEAQMPAKAHVATAASGDALALQGIALADAEGRVLLRPFDLALKPGMAVHIAGASSTGKSTLARVLAGLQSPSKGTVALKPDAQLMLVPQKAYIPLGTLEETLTFPKLDARIARADLVAALDAVGLSALVPRLGETQRWDQLLSAGERQRLAVGRAFIAQPDVLVLDDALSALDERAQADIVTSLRRLNPKLALLSFAQRPAAVGVFNAGYHLTRRDDGGELVADTALSDPSLSKERPVLAGHHG